MNYNFAPYSFSKISLFKQCPKRFKLKYIDKKYFKSENKALEKGVFLHSIIEKAIMDESLAPLEEFKFSLSNSEDITSYVKILDDFFKSKHYKKYKKGSNKITEQGFSLRVENGNIISDTYKKASLIRGYIDFLSIDESKDTYLLSKNPEAKKATIVDWKSGKYKKDIDKLQVEIYALWAFLHLGVDEVDCEFCFLESDLPPVKRHFFRNDINDLKKILLKNVIPIEESTKYPKKVTPLCDWCEYKTNDLCDGEENLSPKITIGCSL